MATTEEIFRLVQQVEGTDKVARLKHEVEQAEAALRDLMATQRAMGSSGSQMASMVENQAQALHRLQAELTQAKKAADRLSGGTRDGGRAIMEFSRATEDAQYGLAGVLNNLPGLVAALGGGAGLAGVISLVSVGAYQLYKHWDELADLWGGGHTKTQAQEMEELAKKTEKTAAETEKLAKWEETRKRMAAQGAKPEAQSKQETAIDKAISEAGVGNVARGLDTHFGTEIQRRSEVDDPAAYRELEDAKAARDAAFKRQVGMNKASPGSGDDLVAEALARVEKAQAAANTAYVNARGKFSTDPANAARLQKTVQANPKDFGPNGEQLAKGLSDALNPQQVVLRKVAKDAGEAFGKWWQKLQEEAAEQAAKQAKAAAAAKAKAADEYLDDAAKSWDESLKAARKSRSWAGKKDGDMTPAELLAKQEHDQAEEKIAEATAKQSWLGREDEELSPEERTAKRRFEASERERKQRRTEAERQADALRREQLQAPGLDDYVRDALLNGASDRDVAGVLRGLGIDDQGVGEALLNGKGAAYQSLLKGGEVGNSQTLQGGEALRDAIQGGVTNQDYGRQQLDRLTACEGYLRAISQNRPDLTATAG